MADEEKRNYPKLIMKYKQPTITPNGKRITYNNRIYNNTTISLEHEKINFFRNNILTNDEILRAPSGFYTWIIRGTNFYTSQTLSNQELGTLHKNLLDLTNYKDKNPLFAAGELKIDNGKFLFNLQSGLFDVTILKKYKTYNSKRNFVINTVVPHVIETLKSAGVNEHNIQFLDCDDSSNDICDDTEKTGGKHILSKNPIISSQAMINKYNYYFNRRNNKKSGGSRRRYKKKAQTKKRRLTHSH